MRLATIVATLLLASIAPLVGAEIPRKAPEFVIYLPDGSQKLLSSYRGKVVVLEFAFTTCSHCQHSAEMLTKLQKEYGAKGFQPLAVAFNPMAKMLVPDFVRDYKVGFPVGYSTERDPVNNFLQNPPNEALHVPQLVFIDRKGMIRKQSLPRNDVEMADEKNVRKLIETLLAEPAGGGTAPAKAAAKKK